ncbi:TonB family protein [bacterium]|nr:TonB family protein [bacterium]
MKKSFIGSLVLHAAFLVVLIVASYAKTEVKRPLPDVTNVRLIRPKPVPVQSSKIAEDIKVPETQKPLETPKKEPKKKVKEEKKPEPPKEKKVRSSDPVPKELVGEAGTLKLQNPGFDYDFYLALIQSKIERNFRPPPGVRAGTMATVGFVILRDGTVSSITMVQSSKNLLIDQAAERAVRAAGKFPPLPPQYDQGELGINFEFVVNPSARS